MSNSPDQTTSYTVLLGSLIARLRKQNSFDQIQFAELIGMSQPTLSKIENGQIVLSVVQLKIIAENLNTSPGSILENVELIVNNLEERGIVIKDHKPDQTMNFFLGAAAIAGILAYILSDQ